MSSFSDFVEVVREDVENEAPSGAGVVHDDIARPAGAAGPVAAAAVAGKAEQEAALQGGQESARLEAQPGLFGGAGPLVPPGGPQTDPIRKELEEATAAAAAAAKEMGSKLISGAVEAKQGLSNLMTSLWSVLDAPAGQVSPAVQVRRLEGVRGCTGGCCCAGSLLLLPCLLCIPPAPSTCSPSAACAARSLTGSLTL
jgi:hypothetical protein